MSLSNSDLDTASRMGALIFPDKKAPVEKVASEPIPEVRAPASEREAPQEASEDTSHEAAEGGADDLGDDLPLDDKIASHDDDADEEPSITPPSGLNAAEKELFKSLPVEAQRAWERRERDRTSEFHRLQSKTAEQQKAFDAAMAQLNAERQQLQIERQQAGNSLFAEFQKKFADVTDPIELARQDPMRALEYQGYIARLQQQAAADQQLKVQQEQERQQNLGRFRQEQNEELVRLIPNLKDQAAFEKFDADVTTFLREQGFNDNAIIGADAKSLAIANDAMKWRKAQAARKAAEAKTPPPQVLRPGAKRDIDVQEQRQAALRQRLKKSGDVKDAAALIRNLL